MRQPGDVFPAGEADEMKISEKSLELNVGAELLAQLRGPWGMLKAYLRGLTQREESREGVDFFAQMSPRTRIFAFQFKAPKGSQEGEPYRFTIQRRQHEKLSEIARESTGNVFYVLPYYALPAKLQCNVPNLLADTWFLPLCSMKGTNPFGTFETRTARCERGLASVNPDYELRKANELEQSDGIPVERFAEWYSNLHEESNQKISLGRGKNPWLVRGLRVAIVQPTGEQEQ